MMQTLKTVLMLQALASLATSLPQNKARSLAGVASTDDSGKRDVVKTEDLATQDSRYRSRDDPANKVPRSTNLKHFWPRIVTIAQPDLPEFIDTGACLCGLLLQESTLNYQGELVEMWRCSASLDTDISVGTSGKWYNTTLPSQDLSGVNEPRTWYYNPPYVNQTYVLLQQESGKFYEPLNSVTSGALNANDKRCNGIKDAAASAAFYATQS